MATFTSITLPERGPQIQLLLPESEFIYSTENLRVADFGEITMDDFEQWETAAETQMKPSQSGDPSVSDKTPSVEIPREQQLFPEMPEDFGIVDQIMGETTPGKYTPDMGRISEIPEEPIGVSPGFETFEIPTEEPAKKKRKLVSKGKLIIDEETSIPSSEFKQQISNASDTLRTLKTAPKTKESLFETPQNFTSMLNQPNISGLPFEFQVLYSKKRMREDLSEREQIRENEFGEIPDTYIPQPSPTEIGEGFGGIDMPEDIQHEMITPEKEVRPSIGGNIEIPSTKKKSKKPKKAETEEERESREALAKEYKGKGITDKTLKVLGLLKESFKDQQELSVEAMLMGRKRNVAAKYFFELLVLQSKGIINTEQEEPFGDIILSKTEQFV
jgi:chromatin segregation and condensation protein Rec8/ScpA/Scc1 (kleisin family)